MPNLDESIVTALAESGGQVATQALCARFGQRRNDPRIAGALGRLQRAGMLVPGSTHAYAVTYWRLTPAGLETDPNGLPETAGLVLAQLRRCRERGWYRETHVEGIADLMDHHIGRRRVTAGLAHLSRLDLIAPRRERVCQTLWRLV